MLISTIVYLITLAMAFALADVFFIHMFQLESYLKPQFLKWIKENFASKVIGRCIFLLVSFVILLINTGIITLSVCSFFNVLTVAMYRPRKAKKPLVFTTRVQRLTATTVVIFAVTQFLLLKLGLVFIMPCVILLVSFIVLISAYINTPVEKAVRNKYINEAKRIIKSRKHNLVVIGITGSYGKTSTKFYLNKLLSRKYNVLMTPASYNTTMGVVKVIREMLKPSHEIFICEMGARNVGEIKEICDIVLPDYGIITSVGPQHLETFKSIENIINTKFELADAVYDKSKIILNGDNEYILGRNYADSCVYYGINNKNAEFTADSIVCSQNGTEFVLKHKNDSIQLSTKLLGEHNVLNVLASCAAAVMLGVDANDIKTAVRMLETAPHRLEIIDGGNITIIDDAFNSNPAGSKYAVDALSKFDGLKVLVTPGMVELGTKQYELNKEFGAYAAKHCDYIYIVGKVNYDSISEGVKSTDFDYANKLISVAKPEEAVDAVRRMNYSGKKTVLLENDLPDNFK